MTPMKVAVVSTKPYDRQFLAEANADAGHELVFLEPRLTEATVPLVTGYPGVCAFVNDVLNRAVLTKLKAGGTKVIALRCAGFNNVDLDAASELGIRIARVPAYSPYGVAEHTVALMLSLNRQIHRGYNRVREGNFALDGLLGFEMRGLTVGVVGTGKIGAIVARILRGFDCDILAYDIRPEPSVLSLGGRYVEMDELLSQSDIITLHCPLTPQTHHLIDDDAVKKMKPGSPGVMLINTGRGALVHTPAVIAGLKTGKIGSLGLDVYEEEADLFFENLSDKIIQDDIFTRLLTFPNVIVTAHQAFFTRHALEAIAQTTIGNLSTIERGEASPNEVKADRKAR